MSTTRAVSTGRSRGKNGAGEKRVGGGVQTDARRLADGCLPSGFSSVPSWAARLRGMSEFSVSELDAVEWLRGFADESVDLVVTDPPYESLERHRSVGTTTRLKHSKASSNAWFDIFPNERFEALFGEIHRVLKKDAHFYLFCDQETMFVAKPIAEQAGFKFWKPLVWDKKKIGMGYHYRARYELILFFEKGKRKLNNLGIPDIIEATRIYRGYPTEKPAEVSEVLIEQSTEPDELVLDPFMGAGGTGVAATRLGRRFRGNDTCEEAVEISRERLVEAGGREVSWSPSAQTGAEQLGLSIP